MGEHRVLTTAFNYCVTNVGHLREREDWRREWDGEKDRNLEQQSEGRIVNIW